jgi:class 3 adenylate cyclase
MSYTVMGDTVNLASRLEGANKVYGGRVLVSEATIAGVSDAIETRKSTELYWSVRPSRRRFLRSWGARES